MAAIKKDHTLSSHWRGMMDDYLKVWQVLRWWGSSHYPSFSRRPPPPPRLPPPLSAYLGQCFNTPLTWLYWHTPDSVWWLMSMWVPLSLSLPLPLSFFLAFSAPHLPVILFSLSEQYSLAYLTHKAIIARPVTHTRTQRLTHAKTHICGGVHIQKLICTGREWTYITPNLIL